MPPLVAGMRPTSLAARERVTRRLLDASLDSARVAIGSVIGTGERSRAGRAEKRQGPGAVVQNVIESAGLIGHGSSEMATSHR